MLIASDLCGTVAGLLGRKTPSLVWVVPAFPHTFVELSHTHQILREGTCLNAAAGQRSFLWTVFYFSFFSNELNHFEYLFQSRIHEMTLTWLKAVSRVLWED